MAPKFLKNLWTPGICYSDAGQNKILGPS